ncbi:MAG TPA: class I SAM-dependent methyltransferase [Flavitalea sp.]|nr:class I SAM-dependent methyltransferase [Flavitalea sp.]
MKLYLIRFLKSFFIRMRLHLFFRYFTGIHLNLVYLTRFSQWASSQNPAINDFWSKWDYNKRYPFYEKIINMAALDGAIRYLEFGVATGKSFQWWLQQNRHPDSTFDGFDTFDGLPEDWGPYKKGSFGTNYELPQTNDPRAHFHKGLFQQTLPVFLKNFTPAKRLVLMMDADLFSATLYVLTSMAPFLKKGDIILFDEFVVPTHEFMAYYHFIQSYYIDMELIGAANNYYFAAFKVR